MAIRRICSAVLRPFWRNTEGNATMEFMVIVPFLFYIIFSIAEAGVLMVRSVMLDRGLDTAIRDLRLGLTPGIDHDGIKDIICDAAFLLGSCEDVLLLELTPIPNFADSIPATPTSCVDRTSDIDPVISFNPGVESDVMLVRACIVVDPIFPGMGLGALLPKDDSGGYAITSQSAFVNEPD